MITWHEDKPRMSTRLLRLYLDTRRDPIEVILFTFARVGKSGGLKTSCKYIGEAMVGLYSTVNWIES